MCPEWENECMCETECESGWKHSYGVCGGCIIKHNEAIQKTRLVVIAEVNAASIGSAGAAEPGGKKRGRVPSACRRDVTRGPAVGGDGGGTGSRPGTRVDEGGSKISAKPSLPAKSERFSLLRVPPVSSRPSGRFALSLHLSSQLSGEVAKSYPLAPAEGERRSPSLHARRQLEPGQGLQLRRSRQSRLTHAGVEQPQAGLPELAPNELFFFPATQLNNQEESSENDAAWQPAEFNPGSAVRAAPCRAPLYLQVSRGAWSDAAAPQETCRLSVDLGLVQVQLSTTVSNYLLLQSWEATRITQSASCNLPPSPTKKRSFFSCPLPFNQNNYLFFFKPRFGYISWNFQTAGCCVIFARLPFFTKYVTLPWNVSVYHTNFVQNKNKIFYFCLPWVICSL